jgi:hypothetical protein
MRELDEILEDLWAKRTEYKKMVEQRDTLSAATPNQAMRDELSRTVQKYIDQKKAEMKAVVAELVRWPPHKREHFDKLDDFFREHNYENCVFIMTKYPENPPRSALDTQLQVVIDLVKEAVKTQGYTPLLALDKRYHPELFRNIEVYLLGCSKAIAIVESKHTNELNPNVTMEWGWLRASDRQVLYLVEKDFDKARADLKGLIEDYFDWNDPKPGVGAAVKAFLT